MIDRVRVKKQQNTGRTWVHARIERPGEEDEELLEDEKVSVHVFITDPAYVRVGAGVTRKIADFESLRVDAGVSIPCYKEQIEEQFDASAEWVAERLDEQLDQWLGKDEGEDDDDTPPPNKRTSRKKESKKKSKKKTKTRSRRSRRNT